MQIRYMSGSVDKLSQNINLLINLKTFKSFYFGLAKRVNFIDFSAH